MVQVIHVIDQSSVNTALKITPHVDYLLLDSGNPNSEIKELVLTDSIQASVEVKKSKIVIQKRIEPRMGEAIKRISNSILLLNLQPIK